MNDTFGSLKQLVFILHEQSTLSKVGIIDAKLQGKFIKAKHHHNHPQITRSLTSKYSNHIISRTIQNSLPFVTFLANTQGILCPHLPLPPTVAKLRIYTSFCITSHSPRSDPDAKEQPSLHTGGNFSFLSRKFGIVSEEERKRLDSECVFRLEMDLNKDLRIYLQVRLLRKSTASLSQEEAGLCALKLVDYSYQTIDEQLMEIKREDSLYHYERVFFRTSEFYCFVDLYLATFNYGYKYYRSKLQIANLLTGADLNLHSPAGRMKEKCESADRRVSSEAVTAWRAELLQDFSICLLTYYYQLPKIIVEYSRPVGEYRSFSRMLQESQREIKLPQVQFFDLDYIKMQDKVTIQTLSHHFQASCPQEIMRHIFEQKQLMHKHIRRVREKFCLLIPLHNERQFGEMIKKQMEDQETAEAKSFIRYVGDLMLLEEAPQIQARNEAITDFTRSQSLWNTRISTPYFYIQSNSDMLPPRRPALTIFVHGYQGNSFDFQKANYLRRHNKHTHVLIIESITNGMNQSIGSLGKQAAEEVRNEITKRMYEFSQINLIGFSPGGLIARAAFSKLKVFWPLFNLFVTFPSPHTWISECENSLLNLKLWYLIKVDKVKNLKELNFQSVKFQELRLSRWEALAQFRKVVLACSKNDGFVPFYSTVLDQRNCNKQELRQLCRNMTGRIRQVERVELVFDVGKSWALDKLTGRKGHIEFLDNDYFLDIFFKLYGPAM